jgi:hypothetical protein
VGKLEEYGKNQREGRQVAGKGAPGVGSALSRGAGAPDRILPRIGASTGAPAHFWGRQCGPLFGPKPKFRARRVLGGVLGPPVEMPGGDEHLHPTGAPKIVAGMSVLGAPAGPPRKLGPGSHTGGPKTPAPKNCSFINLIPIAIHICL